MEELQVIYSSDPNTNEIALNGQKIQHLEELLPLLSQFRNLRKLSLVDNLMSDLPENMNCLNKLEELNLNGNVFSNTYTTID